jgi:DNA-binding GntR family transcriptional regulator
MVRMTVEQTGGGKTWQESLVQIGRQSEIKTHTGAAVEQCLKAAIEAGSLEPGTRITQQGIADAFQLSRMPVREALIMLESQGYVINHKHKGYVVAPTGADHSSHELNALVAPIRTIYGEITSEDDRLVFERNLIRLLRSKECP